MLARKEVSEWSIQLLPLSSSHYLMHGVLRELYCKVALLQASNSPAALQASSVNKMSLHASNEIFHDSSIASRCNTFLQLPAWTLQAIVQLIRPLKCRAGVTRLIPGQATVRCGQDLYQHLQPRQCFLVTISKSFRCLCPDLSPSRRKGTCSTLDLVLSSLCLCPNQTRLKQVQHPCLGMY